jgi:hypothetical protein
MKTRLTRLIHYDVVVTIYCGSSTHRQLASSQSTCDRDEIVVKYDEATEPPVGEAPHSIIHGTPYMLNSKRPLSHFYNEQFTTTTTIV